MFECFHIVVLKCEVLIWIFYKFFIRALFRKIFSHTFFGQLWHWSVRMCVCWDIPGCVCVWVWLYAKCLKHVCLVAKGQHTLCLGPGSWVLAPALAPGPSLQKPLSIFPLATEQICIHTNTHRPCVVWHSFSVQIYAMA